MYEIGFPRVSRPSSFLVALGELIASALAVFLIIAATFFLADWLGRVLT